MLDCSEFEVLRAYANEEGATVDAIASSLALPPKRVAAISRNLLSEGLLCSDGCLSDRGRAELESYRVKSAVILAAGVGTRLAPFSFERPKALLKVRGEVLIERLIRQLREVGIERIAVVTGYMKESLFYLEDAFGVSIVVNPDYAARNNHSSVWAARRFLDNTYIISSDQYFGENIFHEYCFTSCCTVVPRVGDADELVVDMDERGCIVSAKHGNSVGGYALQGPVFLDANSSRTYLDLLEKEYGSPETLPKSWDEVLAGHIDDLPLYAEKLPLGVITEFDFLTDLVAFDSDFFANVDSGILDNISTVLACTRDEISDVRPVKAGLTNLSTLFSVRGRKYIYRHPGSGTNELINRKAETVALNFAKEIGLDDTFIYENPDEGWKISLYIDGCSELDYSDEDQVRRALELTRRLHQSGCVSPYRFDFLEEANKIIALLEDRHYALPCDFGELSGRISRLAVAMQSEAGDPVLCHNDLYGPNFLVRGNEMRLIDWEYAAMGDPACDLGNFVAQGSGYSVEQTLAILPLYFGRPATLFEERHCLAAVALVGWYWYVWAMYKEALGNPMGEWLYIWYRSAKVFAAAAETRYGFDDSRCSFHADE